jgi:hypothetical protein
MSCAARRACGEVASSVTISRRPAHPPSRRSTRSRDAKRTLMADTCALAQFMPDLPQEHPPLVRLVRRLDDRLLLRSRFTVDSITGILPAAWPSHDSLMRCLPVGQAILDALADAPAFRLAHRCQAAEQHTPLAVSVSNGSATRREDHVPKSRSISSPKSFANLVSRLSVITSNPSTPLCRRRAGMPCCQPLEMIPYCLREHRMQHRWDYAKTGEEAHHGDTHRFT